MSRQAFTLLELLLVVAIIGIFGTILLTIFTTSNLGWNVNNILMDLKQEATRALEAMTRELYKTNSGYVSVTSNQITFKIPVIISSDTDISNNTTGNIRWGAEANTNYRIRYRVNEERKLVREIIDDSGNLINSRILANDVQELNFTSYGTPPASVLIRVMCQKPIRFGSSAHLNFTAESQVSFRN